MLSKTKGFTLIEVLSTMAILAFLATITLPSYQSAIRKSHRADAKITLSKLATLQEQYYFRTNHYPKNFAELLGINSNTTSRMSDEGFYSIHLLPLDETGTWHMTARAVAEQAKDRQCSSFTLSGLGKKTAHDFNNNPAGSCW